MLLIKELSKSQKLFYLTISVILFAGLYYLCDIISDFKTESALDYLHFSLITQTTVGYGISNNKFTQKYENVYAGDKQKQLFHIINMLQLISIFFLI